MKGNFGSLFFSFSQKRKFCERDGEKEEEGRRRGRVPRDLYEI